MDASFFQWDVIVDRLANVGEKSLWTVVAILTAWGLSRMLETIIARSIRNRATKKFSLSGRIRTIISLVASLVRYSIYITAIFIILSNIWHANTGSILVGTAVLGTALGFGSQGLVQDVINGLSLLLENQLNVGDYVEAAGKVGVVKEVGLRTVRIVGVDGMEHLIFTRQITNVSTWPEGKTNLMVELRLKNPNQLAQAETMSTNMLKELARTLPGIFRVPDKSIEYAISETIHILRWECLINPLQAADIRQTLTENLTAVAQANSIDLADLPVKTFIVP
jgi:small conductance mechanosensitive channel